MCFDVVDVERDSVALSCCNDVDAKCVVVSLMCPVDDGVLCIGDVSMWSIAFGVVVIDAG